MQAARLDVPSKMLTVTYNPAKTTPEALRTAVQKTGYGADQITAGAAPTTASRSAARKRLARTNH
ncbi:MAG: hypothetical protein WKG07_38780 [Hymenobacter sp.]